MTVRGRPRPSIHDLGGNINDLIPLFSFRNLVQVHINLPVVSQLDDAAVTDVASSWPKLEKLRLAGPLYSFYGSPEPTPRQPEPPRMTLKALIAFATYCRDLESLTLSIDGTSAVPSPSDGELPAAQLALRWFDVGISPIGKEVESVAKLVGRLFPRLREIVDRSGSARHRWSRVQKLLPQ
ncbi:hypothetical protein FB45DRAFT_782946 [Roridomyces roridus]|uniref:Uncharacterized protein n=1 Tax=Roridomyces roridus TaxID=1738132 RepID=A0AAD7CGQ8_9AGAR|nr:hypothetical protein FB45DRAFT_782946 [Roridomyces roridus]